MKLICWVVKVNLIFVCFMLHWVEGCLLCVRFSLIFSVYAYRCMCGSEQDVLHQ